VWSPVDDHDEAPWVDVRAAAVAKSTTITLFVRINCLQPVSHPSLDNQVFIDAVMLAQAPTVSASSPSLSHSPTFAVDWDDGQPAPGGYIVKYDVQYKDDLNDTWLQWQDSTRDTSAHFAGIVGRTYTFRARAYERYTAFHDIRLAGAWTNGDATTKVATTAGVQGYVRDNRDVRLLSATVTLEGTGISGDTSDGGHYELVPANPGTYNVSASGPGYAAPSEVRGVQLQEDVVLLDFTLLPLDDLVQNGDFEDELSGWQTVTGCIVDPVLEATEPRSGVYSLALGEGSTTGGTCEVIQTLFISPATYLPTLSFWYRTPGGDEDYFLEVGVYHGEPWTYHPLPALPSVEGWTHAWFDVSPFEGEAWISFSYHRQGAQDFVAYLDEVSLGRASGGPLKSFFPLTP
jgi:hypothetical protein